ncbi:MAG: hypothetical protein V4591_06390 [Bdellovibrionota bacterium]
MAISFFSKPHANVAKCNNALKRYFAKKNTSTAGDHNHAEALKEAKEFRRGFVGKFLFVVKYFLNPNCLFQPMKKREENIQKSVEDVVNKLQNRESALAGLKFPETKGRCKSSCSKDVAEDKRLIETQLGDLIPGASLLEGSTVYSMEEIGRIGFYYSGSRLTSVTFDLFLQNSSI